MAEEASQTLKKKKKSTNLISSANSKLNKHIENHIEAHCSKTTGNQKERGK